MSPTPEDGAGSVRAALRLSNREYILSYPWHAYARPRTSYERGVRADGGLAALFSSAAPALLSIRARPAVFSPFAPFRASWRLLYPIDVGSAKVMSVREGGR